MRIELDGLTEETKIKYAELENKVKNLLNNYKNSSLNSFNLVKKKLEQTNGEWDTSLTLVNDGIEKNIDISLLLVFEYCLATERITEGKVLFDEAVNKLFDGVKKFRIGNPVKSIDDYCLYGKGLDDKTAVPVTSKKYRVIMPAGAQHLNYVKDGSFCQAVFIYEKGEIKDFAINEKGESESYPVDGIDFSNLETGQSLLNNLRQTVFHEWIHCAEQDKEIEGLPYEYQGKDGRIYRNYQKVKDYVTISDSFIESQYLVSSWKDENGLPKYCLWKDELGRNRPLSELNFDLKLEYLPQEICISTGLATTEVLPDNTIRMHNMITEGFVELIARTMVKSVDLTADIDKDKYPEYVRIAKEVVKSRDESLGKGATFVVFLTHSSKLKDELESKTVVLDDKTEIDGLHYLSNYANKVKLNETPKMQFFRKIIKLMQELKIPIENVSKSNLWGTNQILEGEKKKRLTELLIKNGFDERISESLISEYMKALKDEKNFFEGIGEKLGYDIKRNIDEEKISQETSLPNLE